MTHAGSRKLRSARPRVAIVGGGFAGLACAQALDAEHFAVTLVDERPHFEFIPNLHELISGLKKPADLQLPLGPLLRDRGHRFRRARVTEINSGDAAVALESGQIVRADYLVVATGSREADYGISGVAAHTLPLKSTDDGRAIAGKLRSLERHNDGGRIVVVGGGLAGVEVLGEVLRRTARSARKKHWDVHLVEAQSRPLPGAPTGASRLIEELCAKLGVTVHLSDPVSRITARTVWLKSGKKIGSDATLWTGGPAPPTLLDASGLSTSGKWVPVAPDLRLPGQERVFVVGDNAELSKPLSRQAYYALDMGAAAAENITRLARGKRTRQFRAIPRPTLITFGDSDCIMTAGRTALAGQPLMALKEGIYSLVMAQLDGRRAQKKLPAILKRARGSSAQLWPLLTPATLLKSGTRLRRLRAGTNTNLE